IDLIQLRYLGKHAPDSVLEFLVEQHIAGVDLTEFWHRSESGFPRSQAARDDAPADAPGPVTVGGRGRSYVVLSSLYAPPDAEPPLLDRIMRLIDTLDKYRLPAHAVAN